MEKEFQFELDPESGLRMIEGEEDHYVQTGWIWGIGEKDFLAE